MFGGLFFLVLLTFAPSITSRTEAGAAAPRIAPDADRDSGTPRAATSFAGSSSFVGGSSSAGSHPASDELCAPEIGPAPHDNSPPHEDPPPHEDAADASAFDGREVQERFGDQLCDDGWIPPPFQHEDRPAVAVDTHVRPGSPLEQTARITNTGGTLLVGLVVGLDVGSCVRGIDLLQPGSTTTVSCTGPAPENGRATANAVGRSPFGATVAAEDEVEVAPPPAPPPPPANPEVELVVGALRPADGNRPTRVPIRITNPSPVALHHVDVTGTPGACARSFERLHPGHSLAYDCQARPGSTVDLTVSARTAGGDLPEGTVVTAAAQALVPPPPPSTGSTPPPPPEQREPAPGTAPSPAPAARPAASEPDEGPLSSPARTAAVISVAAVLVMLVSVGALSTATRPGK